MFKSIYNREYIALVRHGLAVPPPVSGGKGDKILKESETQQLALNKQLQAAFTTNFAKQSAVLDQLTKRLQPMIDNPTGYSPEALTALRTSATDTNSGRFQNAQTALNDQLAARGGAEALPSGVDAQLRAQLGSDAARTEAGTQNQITLDNENLKQQNMWNAVGALSGTAQGYNPLGFSGGATAGGTTVANLGQAYKESQKSGLLGAISGVVGGALTGGIGAGIGKRIAR
jgi:hypothetical protein